jgi:hypothetical protein
MRKLTVTLELAADEAIALRDLARRLLSRDIEATLADEPAGSAQAADEARSKLSCALQVAIEGAGYA